MSRGITLMGMRIDDMSEPEALEKIFTALDAGHGGTVITAHLEILRQHCTRPALRSLFEKADLVLADGQPLVWASRIKRTPLPERVAGSDLVWSLMAECALRDRSVYLLGGAPGVCEGAVSKLREAYPGLRIAGVHSLPMGFEADPDGMASIRVRLRAARPDVVLVALGFPKQERVIAELRPDFPAIWFVGVGVSLSFIAGHVARAPDWAIRLGLEWLHRLLQEPRRLFGRYVVHGLPFAARLFAHAAGSRLLRGGGQPPPAPRATPTEPLGTVTRVVFHHGALERRRMRELADIVEHDATPDHSRSPATPLRPRAGMEP